MREMRPVWKNAAAPAIETSSQNTPQPWNVAEPGNDALVSFEMLICWSAVSVWNAGARLASNREDAPASPVLQGLGRSGRSPSSGGRGGAGRRRVAIATQEPCGDTTVARDAAFQRQNP